MDRVLDLLTELQSGATDPWATVTQHFNAIGVNGVVCGRIKKKTGRLTGILLDTPDNWHDRYLAEDYAAIDPWAKRAPVCEQPFIYSFDERSRTLPDSCTKVEQMCREMTEVEMRSAVLFPALTTSTATIAINLWSNENARQFEIWAGERQDMLSLMTCVSATYLTESLGGNAASSEALIWSPKSEPENPLTPREQEALLWLAKGYRTDRISDRMNITNATVAFHIQSARKRLGAATREQAVALAITRGFVAV